MKFEGNVALVIGSATGMGRATVTKLVNEGAHVIAFDLLEEVKELENELRGVLGTVVAYRGDITDVDKRKGVIEYIKGTYGKLDTLAYIAGTIDMMTPVNDMDDELWDYVMDVNVNAAFKVIRDALPLLENHEGTAANIIIVGSVGGIFGSTAGPAYITSKHAVLGLMKNLAWSFREKNIRVNAVNPGMIATSITKNALLKWPDRESIHPAGMDLYVMEGATTLGTGEMGKAEDIAEAICFLISDKAKYICGAELTVDGGWTTF
jgi:NAD(P)-dependent dehydrogenase (short-subunit alcohol dehydrogenase family)